VGEVAWTPDPAQPGGETLVTARVTNNGAQRVEDAIATVRVLRVVADRTTTVTETSTPISLDAGESTTVSLRWTTQAGAFWAEAFVQPPGDAAEATAEDNHAFRALLVNAVVDPAARDQVERPEKATFKTYYETLILVFYLPIVVPLIALFYAGGVLLDERERNGLLYLLTRPIGRWLIPITKFLAGFAVGALAVIVGLVVSYALMFGTFLGGAASAGYLAAPLTLALLALAAYLALFTLVGVWSERPYVVGLLFVLGWETAAARIAITTEAGTRPLLPWVGNLTVLQHVNDALAGWDFEAGLQWLPQGDEARRALVILAGIAIAGLALASYWMRRRDFHDA
jgi:ABC-type transport system involved in multi-copper enzyme maturation permease subunit